MVEIWHKLEFAFPIAIIVCPFLKGSGLETFHQTSINLGEDLDIDTKSDKVRRLSGLKWESQENSPIRKRTTKDKCHNLPKPLKSLC